MRNYHILTDSCSDLTTELRNKYDIDYGEADTVSENENAVRIMSIHKSKGLEFPIVFVSGMGKKA